MNVSWQLFLVFCEADCGRARASLETDEVEGKALGFDMNRIRPS
jgi:hypothetical protein